MKILIFKGVMAFFLGFICECVQWRHRPLTGYLSAIVIKGALLSLDATMPYDVLCWVCMYLYGSNAKNEAAQPAPRRRTTPYNAVLITCLPYK